MTDLPNSPADPPFSPPTGAPASLPPPDAANAMPGRSSGGRPRWGVVDVILGFPFFLVMAFVGLTIGIVVEGVDLASLGDADAANSLPFGVLAMSLVFQQVAQGAWPWLVSKWKGLGFRSDWHVYFKLEDLWLGLATAFIGLIAAFAVGSAVGALVGLTDDAEADNTQFLRDAEGTPWLYLLLFAVVVGAPVTEELFFRGLTLRAIDRSFNNKALAVLGSSAIFALPHFTGSGWQGTAVLLASIFAVGVVLALAVYRTGRLGTAIVAHMMFNAVGAAGALGYFDRFVS